jgi:hypothetical protein
MHIKIFNCSITFEYAKLLKEQLVSGQLSRFKLENIFHCIFLYFALHVGKICYYKNDLTVCNSIVACK